MLQSDKIKVYEIYEFTKFARPRKIFKGFKIKKKYSIYTTQNVVYFKTRKNINFQE